MNKPDLNKIIDKRKEVLEKRRLELEQFRDKLSLSSPIEFYISDIEKEVNPREKYKKVGVANLNFLETVKGPVVYIYEIVDKNINDEIYTCIMDSRSIKNIDKEGIDQRRSTSKVPITAKESNTNVLYVGSVEQYIHSRTRQHLGFGNPQTFSLQLKHWAKSEWKFRFYYIEVKDRNILRDIEAALADYFDPLVGK